eukprot:scaffold603_cov404-Prasinococcus_capsulatus_cf.AAC.43
MTNQGTLREQGVTAEELLMLTISGSPAQVPREQPLEGYAGGSDVYGEDGDELRRRTQRSAGTSDVAPVAADRQGVRAATAAYPTAMWNLPVRLLQNSFRFVTSAVGLGFQIVGFVAMPLLRLVGGLGTGIQSMGTEQFLSEFEGRYGVHHPIFHSGTYSEAMREAQRTFKFLLVYLHSAEHTNTPAFCRNILCDPEVVEFLDENFVVWAGDIRGADAYQMSYSLRASTFPYVAVLGHFNGHIQFVAQIEGPTRKDRFVSTLQQAMDNYSSMLAAERAEADSRTESRRLREEQDAAYLAALAEDQAKDRQRREEQERVATEEAERKRMEEEVAAQAAEEERLERERYEAVEQRRAQKAAVLATEPEDGPGVCKIAIRMIDGSRQDRRFNGTDTVRQVYDFVDSLGVPFQKYTLATNFPRKVLTDEICSQTLEEAGLSPQALLFIKQEDD